MLATHQAPTYTKKCDKCTWQSIDTTDPSAYSGAVADYKLHMELAHGDTKNNGESSSRCEESEEYRKATELVDVPATQDDCHLNLCPFRFWRAPLSWKSRQLRLPVEQSPVCTVGDYEAYGMEVKEVIKDLQQNY